MIQANQDSLQKQVIQTLQTVFDPEIPINIWDLGLIYGVHVDDLGICVIVMTFTSPNCPVIDVLPEEIIQKTSQIDGIKKVLVDIVWQPKWDMSIVSDDVKLDLGIL
jgi:FeS assembly SUF system protein